MISQSPRALLRSVSAIIAIWAFLAAGCTGHASINVARLSIKNISTAGPLVRRITPDECYYWINDKKELCVAMRETSLSWLGSRFRREFVLSLVLEGLPAGSTRNYPVKRRTLRSRHQRGYAHVRSASLGGIAAVWDFGRRKLHGRFRAVAKEQSYSVLNGWGSNRRVLIVGEFTGVENQRAGEKILAHTEENGMERGEGRPKPKSVKGPPRKSRERDRTN
ncbi:MAG: hypothetical protein ACYS8K_07115 [Planctomycetota bacterium]|jgi:hypothetical protein